MYNETNYTEDPFFEVSMSNMTVKRGPPPPWNVRQKNWWIDPLPLIGIHVP